MNKLTKQIKQGNKKANPPRFGKTPTKLFSSFDDRYPLSSKIYFGFYRFQLMFNLDREAKRGEIRNGGATDELPINMQRD